MNITRPRYDVAPLATGLAWRPDAPWRYEQKMDGVWHVRQIGDAVVAGELMRSGEYYAFDAAMISGQDIRTEPLRIRLEALDALAARHALLRPACGCGGEFLEAVLRDGGEGVVAKNLNATWGEPLALWKCKRLATWDCVVAEMHPFKRSIRVELAGDDCGWVPAFSRYDSLTPGMVVEVAAQYRHASGKFREPRLVRPRLDKQEDSI